jgi:hypothetical protein
MAATPPAVSACAITIGSLSFNCAAAVSQRV